MTLLLTCVLSFLTLPSLAFAAAPENFSELAENLVGLMNAATGVLIVLGLVVYFWGMSVNILKFEEDVEKRKAYFVWGVIVLFVMVSIWGIIALLQRTLFGTP